MSFAPIHRAVFAAISLSVAAVAAAATAELDDQETAAREIEEVLSGSYAVEILSIDPHPELKNEGRKKTDPNEHLGRWRVVGKARVTDKAKIRLLRETLARGVRESTGVSGFCFEPPHALRVETDHGQVVMIICFHCLSAVVQGSRKMEGFLVTDSPEPTFDAIFSAAGLPKIK